MSLPSKAQPSVKTITEMTMYVFDTLSRETAVPTWGRVKGGEEFPLKDIDWIRALHCGVVTTKQITINIRRRVNSSPPAYAKPPVDPPLSTQMRRRFNSAPPPFDVRLVQSSSNGETLTKYCLNPYIFGPPSARPSLTSQATIGSPINAQANGTIVNPAILSPSNPPAQPLFTISPIWPLHNSFLSYPHPAAPNLTVQISLFPEDTEAGDAWFDSQGDRFSKWRRAQRGEWKCWAIVAIIVVLFGGVIMALVLEISHSHDSGPVGSGNDIGNDAPVGD
jgi:hypothetical protein